LLVERGVGLGACGVMDRLSEGGGGTPLVSESVVALIGEIMAAVVGETVASTAMRITASLMIFETDEPIVECWLISYIVWTSTGISFWDQFGDLRVAVGREGSIYNCIWSLTI
jgi:hypothetical protein